MALGATLLAACASDDAPPPAESAPTHFTVRGRWDEPVRLTYWVEERDAPVPMDALRSAVDRACAVWAATGVVEFAPASDAESASVTLGFRRGHHGACLPFGVNGDVAHSGPVESGTFVHFDADRAWKAGDDAAGAGHSIEAVAAHELGHVLGLGHSVAVDALMRTGDIPAAALSASDACGLHSLYGGGVDAPGDLEIVHAARGTRALRQVAPIGKSQFDVFDTDGDGRDEVVVWRTDKQGSGMVTSYRFDDACRLSRTVGPLLAMSSTGADHVLVKTDAGERLFVIVFPNGRRVARRFDEHGLLTGALDVAEHAALVDAAIAAPSRQTDERSGNLDGDGKPETVRLRRRP